MTANVTCEVCGLARRVPPSRAKTFRTCSHACFAIKKAGGVPPQLRTCRHCGVTENVSPDRAKRPFCSMACRAAFDTLPPKDLKPRDPEARRVQRSRSKVKATHRRKGFVGDVGALSVAAWKEIVRAYADCCAYCGGLADKLTIDHIIPASKGGKHVAANVVPACMWCNQSKKDRDRKPERPAEWAEIEATLGGE